MKSVFFTAAFALLFGVAIAQKSKVPEAVTTKFKTSYPTVTKVSWDTEGANYEAEFKMNNVEMSVLYDASANVVETETGMAVGSLLPKITTYMSTNVKGKKISEASKIVDAAGKITYEAEAGGMDYIFDDQGNFIKSGKSD